MSAKVSAMMRPRAVAYLTLIVLALAASTLRTASAADAADAALEQKILEVIRQHPREIMEAVAAYQREQLQKRQQAQETRIRQQVATLKPGELMGKSPTRGAAAQRLVLVEFSDFQCPYCGRAFATVQAFMQAHGDEVTLVYKHLPLVDLHPEASNAALAAWAAQQQGKFWEFHDALFGAQDKLGDAYYTQIAQHLGLDLARFDRDRRSDAARDAINTDLALAHTLGIDSTPTFLLNQEAIAGAAPRAEFERVLGVARGALPKAP